MAMSRFSRCNSRIETWGEAWTEYKIPLADSPYTHRKCSSRKIVPLSQPPSDKSIHLCSPSQMPHDFGNRPALAKATRSIFLAIQTQVSCRFLLAVDSLGLRRKAWSSSQSSIKLRIFRNRSHRHRHLSQLGSSTLRPCPDNLGHPIFSQFCVARQSSSDRPVAPPPIVKASAAS